MMLTKVDVFDTQAQAFKQAQAGAVEELGLEPEGGVVDVFEEALDFGFGEDDGQAFVFFGAQGVDAGEFDVEDLFIQKEDGLHGHVLGAGGDIVDGGEENLNIDTPNGQINIAYFILVHRFPEQFKRLFKAIYHPENYYLIHLDKKTGVEICEDIQDFLTDFQNTYILESKNVVWGGYSMVQAELSGIKYLLDISAEWDFFINLSGQDYPLKSQKIIRDFLTKNKGNSFIKIANQASERPETMNRIENYFVETNTGFSGVPCKRAFLKDVISYIGGQWMILTRQCCEFICNSGEAKKFEDFYLNTLIADESFFQTVLMNTSFDGNIINDDKRAIIWIPDGDIKLRPKTFTKDDIDFLLSGDNLFARKFDDNMDANILDIMETNFDLPLISGAQHKIGQNRGQLPKKPNQALQLTASTPQLSFIVGRLASVPSSLSHRVCRKPERDR